MQLISLRTTALASLCALLTLLVGIITAPETTKATTGTHQTVTGTEYKSSGGSRAIGTMSTLGFDVLKKEQRLKRKLKRIQKRLKRRIRQRNRQWSKFESTRRAGNLKAFRQHKAAVQKLKELELRTLRQIRKLELAKQRQGANARISEKGLDLITHFEGFYPYVYLDPVGIPTVGYGHTQNPYKYNGLSKKQARELLRRDLHKRYEPPVRKLFSPGGPLYGKFTQDRYDALVSFAYNLGPGAVSMNHSGFRTMNSALKSGDINQIAAAFPLYAGSAAGRLPGLVRRREAERKLFLGKNWR
jgi:lysozyme